MKSFYVHPDLTWRPITDIEPLRIAPAWPERAANPVREFVGSVLRLES